VRNFGGKRLQCTLVVALSGACRREGGREWARGPAHARAHPASHSDERRRWLPTRAGSLQGSVVGAPRWVTMSRIADASVMPARMGIAPPDAPQTSRGQSRAMNRAPRNYGVGRPRPRRRRPGLRRIDGQELKLPTFRGQFQTGTIALGGLCHGTQGTQAPYP
jgi:hypothetical protein